MKARSHGLSILVVAALMVTCLWTAPAEAGLGLGVHYLRNLGDISNDDAVDLKQDSFSLLASFKNKAGMLNLNGQIEYISTISGRGTKCGSRPSGLCSDKRSTAARESGSAIRTGTGSGTRSMRFVRA